MDVNPGDGRVNKLDDAEINLEGEIVKLVDEVKPNEEILGAIKPGACCGDFTDPARPNGLAALPSDTSFTACKTGAAAFRVGTATGGVIVACGACGAWTRTI